MKLSEVSGGGGDAGAKRLKLSDAQEASDDTSLPFEDEPGMRRNPILPFAQRLGEKRRSERGEFRPGFNSCPEHARATLIRKKSQATKIHGDGNAAGNGCECQLDRFSFFR